MNQKKRKGIIIQARMGSSRLPGKMKKKFFDGKTLLEVVLERLGGFSKKVKVVMATTDAEPDNYIAEKSASLGFEVYRGSETDVMRRFIGAAEEFEIDQIIRVCADNPFIQPAYVDQLVSYNSNFDNGYVGFRLNGTIPAIKTHFGFFPERISLEAIKSIYNPGLNMIYREHVTNYFYSEDNVAIPVEWIDLDFPVEFVRNRRFTIDTANDFQIAEKIYKYLIQNDKAGTVNEVFEFVESNPAIVTEMEKSIIENEK
jgi:spore coat polysaccharide biosynthesis protein SpsF